MKKTVCDCCGKEIMEPFRDYRGDLDCKTLAIIEIRPISLNKYNSIRETDVKISDPDLCRECIIKILRG